MALISCPECNQSISERAVACPHCGNPMARALPELATAHVSVTEESVVTTQATGKGPKTVQVIGAMMIVVGVVACVANPASSVGAAGFSLLGLLVWLAGRFSAWWRHG
jgi:hypothetical protein